MTWTTPASVRQYVRRQWDRGRILASLAGQQEVFPLRVPLKGPTSEELASRFGEVQSWIAQLRSGGPGFRVELRSLKHRVIGANSVPARIWVDSLDDAMALLKKGRDVTTFRSLLRVTRERCPGLLAWLEKRPLRALEVAGEWPSLLDIVNWLQVHPRPGVYLRQVDFPGVHTKVVERHKGVLAELLNLALPAEAVNTQPGASFESRFGFLEKSARVRFRALDTLPELPDGFSDLSVLEDEFARFVPSLKRVFITENETNFLTFPAVSDSLLVFGSGYAIEALRRARWLLDRSIYYWGDIDTHGFGILNQLRGFTPHARSLLMDRATLMEHRDHWVQEGKPCKLELARLNDQEKALYEDLRSDRLAPALRLEQEFIRFPWLETALGTLPSI